MASHKLAIAKASFSAGLLRPDPTSLSRDDIALFHTLLQSTVTQCTPINVQTCKRWISENIFQSAARFTALGKYLTALATSFGEDGVKSNTSAKREPSTKRKRLHLLYLVNDILYHAKYQVNDASICSKLQPILMNLLGSAASFTGCPKHIGKIIDLLGLWEDNGYYSKDYIAKLREAVRSASDLGLFIEGDGTSGTGLNQGSETKTTKSAPFVMPAFHGDPSIPWFDLPAGNLMPHIVPNSTRPINPDMIKPLQFVAGPADDALAVAVKQLLVDVDKIFGGEADQHEKASWDIDELGQPMLLDEITGDVLGGEGYYGWSQTFCEKMKRRRKGLDMPDRAEGRGRSRSRSSSPSRKRQRYSDSQSSSRSRSPSPRGKRDMSKFRSRSYSRSPRRSGSPSRPGSLSNDDRPLSRGRPDSLPPKPQGPHPGPNASQFHGQYNAQFPPHPPPLQSMPYNQHYGTYAPPPPPIQAFAGQWPPPPPPGPPNFQQPSFQPPNYQHSNYQQQNVPQQNYQPQYLQGNYQQQGQWPPPPPPGPPPGAPPGGWQQMHPQMHPNNNGRGGFNGNNGWNSGSQGRGNYRGRGW